jgi:acyl dehydratase
VTHLKPAEAAPGDKLPDLEFGPVTRTMLALYAGASGDHNPAHIDLDFAKSAGLPDVFAHGMLSFGVLAQVVTRWAGVDRLRQFGARFVSVTQVHEWITCRGEVVERFEAEGETRLRIAVTATAQDGRQTLAGEAIIALGA